MAYKSYYVYARSGEGAGWWIGPMGWTEWNYGSRDGGGQSKKYVTKS